MKRLILVLLLAFAFASCDKVEDYLSYEVVSINAKGEVWYSITNHSAYEFEIKAILTIETGDDVIKYTTDCFTIAGMQTITEKYEAFTAIYFAEIEVKKCK